MRMSRAVLLAVAAWLAVVAVGSTAVWFVISSAGETVGTAEDAPARAVPTVRGRAKPHPQRTSRPPRTQLPASPLPSTSPAATPSAPPPSASSAQPPARRRTWQGTGGSITAECRGAVIGLALALPDDGFATDVGDRGPVTVEVHFTGQEDQSGRQSEVTARCSAGVPVFRSQVEGGGGGGDE